MRVIDIGRISNQVCVRNIGKYLSKSVIELDLKTRLVVSVFLLVLSLHLLVLVRIERFTPFWSMFVKGHMGQRDLCYPHLH